MRIALADGVLRPFEFGGGYLYAISLVAISIESWAMAIAVCPRCGEPAHTVRDWSALVKQRRLRHDIPFRRHSSEDITPNIWLIVHATLTFKVSQRCHDHERERLGSRSEGVSARGVGTCVAEHFFSLGLFFLASGGCYTTETCMCLFLPKGLGCNKHLNLKALLSYSHWYSDPQESITGGGLSF
ncbi:hypothetical protein CC2G_011800 [Coprinopsis cinerea AmutBmut pab1-1]|nr:hypothetical protein CC2G_011800 [Coprinopsis cinerea AmutBmut pab1-1]